MLKKTETATRPVRGIPFTRFVGDLDRKKIMLVSNAGIAPRFKSFSEPTEGYYIFSKDIQIDELYIPKRHPGLEDVHNDLNCLFPIEPLRKLAKEGMIKEPTEEHLSVYGFHFVARHIKKIVAPHIAEIVEASDTGAAVIIGGCLMCHRIGAIVQKAIEDRGIPTVMISQYPKLSQYYDVSRIFYPVGFRPGHAVGPPDNPKLQKKVLADALQVLVDATEPLTLIEKEYPEYPDPRPKRKYRKRLKMVEHV